VLALVCRALLDRELHQRRLVELAVGRGSNALAAVCIIVVCHGPAVAGGEAERAEEVVERRVAAILGDLGRVKLDPAAALLDVLALVCRALLDRELHQRRLVELAVGR